MENKFYLKTDQAKIDQSMEATSTYVDLVNKLLHALRSAYKDKLGFRFDYKWLNQYLIGGSPEPRSFYKYIFEGAKKHNTNWHKHAELMSIEITPEAFKMQPLNDRVVSTLREFGLLINDSQEGRKLGLKFINQDEDNGDCALDEPGFKAYLKDLHSVVLTDEREIELYKKSEAAATILNSLMKDVLEITPEEDQPSDLFGNRLKYMNMEILFDVDQIAGIIKPSEKVIPRFLRKHMLERSYVLKQLRSVDELRDRELNPDPGVNPLSEEGLRKRLM